MVPLKPEEESATRRRRSLHCEPTDRPKIPFASTKQQTSQAPQSAAGPTSLVLGTRTKGALAIAAAAATAAVPFASTLPPPAVIRFSPTGWLDKDGESQPRFGHATCSYTEAFSRARASLVV